MENNKDEKIKSCDLDNNIKEDLQIDLFAKEVKDAKDVEISKKEIKAQINTLRKQIDYLNKKYYEEDEPEVSDYAYDSLTQKLKKLEESNPEIVNKTSPTQKIGGKIKKEFSKVEHSVQMQSLQDVFSYEDIELFVKKVMAEYGEDTEFIVETKIDGLSLSLEYLQGRLVKGSTRGNGFIGEDVTENIKVIDDIPHKLKSNDTIEIRGEVYLSKKEFEKINEELVKIGRPLLSNPRNAAAGTLRQLNVELVKDRKLKIFVFSVLKRRKRVFNGFSKIRILR
ncbi:MAG: hypothetical protein RSE00_04625 [Clostridia bacterium]